MSDAAPPGPVRRIAAVVEYDGTDYAGWQSQAHAPSLQEAVEAALAFVAGARVAVICAGRTDAGVHAAGQVIHFDTGAERTARAWVLGSNTRLPSTGRSSIERIPSGSAIYSLSTTNRVRSSRRCE